MKRHVRAGDPARSVRFYSQLFAREPSVPEAGYASAYSKAVVTCCAPSCCVPQVA